MGVEIPVVTADKPDGRPVYGFNGTSSALDEASVKFNEVKVMTVKLTEIENAVYRYYRKLFIFAGNRRRNYAYGK